MTDLPVSLKDSSNPQKYYAVIEHMADDDLDVFEYRLYGHYKRVCGQEGACWESVRTTAEKCGMSAGMVSKARRGLVEKGFISETVITKDSAAGKSYTVGIAVELVDRWLENVKRYSPSEQGCSPHEQGVHQVKQRSNHKKKEPASPDAKKQRQVAPRKPADNKPVQPHIAIIDAWYDGMPVSPIVRKYPRNVTVASRLVGAGYTPEQVRKFVEDRYLDPFWAGKKITLEHVEDNIPLWIDQQKAKTNGRQRAETPPLSEAERTAKRLEMFGVGL